MILNKVSNKYAASLLEIVNEKKIDTLILKDVEMVIDLFDSSPQLKRVIANPVVKPEIKQNILEEIFKNKISKELFEFMIFVLKKNREELLYEILKCYLNLRDEFLGLIKVEVTACVNFSEEQEKLLIKKLEEILNKKVILSFKIDPLIIGGFIARTNNTVIDASLKHQLDSIRKQFLKSTIALN